MDNTLNLVKKIMQEKFGKCMDNNHVLRSMACGVGYFDGNVIIEVSRLYFPKNVPANRPVLQFLSTLAQNVEDEIVSELKEKLTELNGVTMLGYYGYYAPLKQVYHNYRLPINPNMPEEVECQVVFCLDQILRQLDNFLDYVMILADKPDIMTLKNYILGTNADLLTGESGDTLNHLT